MASASPRPFRTPQASPGGAGQLARCGRAAGTAPTGARLRGRLLQMGYGRTVPETAEPRDPLSTARIPPRGTDKEFVMPHNQARPPRPRAGRRTARGRCSSFGPGYFETRLAHNVHRSRIWEHICGYLRRWIPADADVLELGAGWCDFSNIVEAGPVVAMDIDTSARAARDGSQAVVGDCTDLSRFADGEFDVVFASNLLEHLDRPTPAGCSPKRPGCCAPAARLILLQPELPARSRPLLRRLHPCRDLHRPVAAGLPDRRRAGR